MHTGILFNEQAELCAKIVHKEKDIIVRREKVQIDTPFKGYIYCAAGSKTQVTCDGAFMYLKPVWLSSKGQVVFGADGDATHCKLLNGVVIGEFICNTVHTYTELDMYVGMDEISDSEVEQHTGIDLDTLLRYKGRRNVIYGYVIDNFKLYTTPKRLSEFYNTDVLAISDLGDTVCSYCKPCDFGTLKHSVSPNGYIACEGCYCQAAYEEYLAGNAIQKAPGSWCYVKTL